MNNIIKFATVPFSRVGSPLKSDDIHGLLLEKYMAENMFSIPVIQAYDYWLDTILPKFLKEKFYFQDGSYIYIDNLQIQEVNYTDKPPVYYREKGLSYQIKIEGDLHLGSKFNQETPPKKITLTEIPLMLGSRRCIIGKIKGSSDYEKKLYEIGEDHLDPFGYFIINGTERAVIIQEKLRLNKHLNIVQMMTDSKTVKDITPEKIAVLVGVNTYETHYGTRMFKLSKNSEDGIDLFLSFFGSDKDKSTKQIVIPCFLLFKHKDFNLDIDEIMDLILSFSPPENRILIQVFLSKARFDFENSGDLYEFLFKPSPTRNFEQFKRDFDEHIKRRFFPLCISNSAKAAQFAFAICRYSETLMGIRIPDDRDIWAHKRLEWAPKSMENLFNSLWNNIYNSINKDIMAGVNITLNSVYSVITKEAMTTTFSRSFAGPKWGKASNTSSDRMTEALESRTILNVYSQLTKVNVKTSEKSKTVSIRMVQGDQWGYICPSETSDGELCGIVKHLASTCKISLERDPGIIIEFLKNRISPVKTEYQKSPIMINGYIHGWCDGIETRNYLVDLRRLRSIWEDTSVVLEDYDFLLERTNYDYKVLNVYCDSGRPIRPLLIYSYNKKNPIEGDLPDKNFSRTFREMVNEGLIEFIDPSETNYILLAQDFSDIEIKKNNFIRQKKLLENDGDGDDDGDDGEDDDGDKDKNENENILIRRKKLENSYLDALKRLKYTHVQISPDAILGYASNTVPMSNRIAGPRVGYQAGMNKQAIETERGTNKESKYTSAAGTSPNFLTNINKLIKTDIISGGRNLSVAIMTFLGYNQEDAIIVNRDIVDKLYFSYYKNVTKEIQLNAENMVKETPGFPRGSENLKKNPYYRHISDAGFPKIGSLIKENDVLVVKYDENNNVNPIKASIDDEGRVIDVKVTDDVGTKSINCKIKIKKFMLVQEGDKMAIRYSQKGVIGKILPAVDMPVMENGKAVDMIINPQGLPTRMTVSLLIELLTGDYSAMVGERINATAFKSFDIEEFMKKMEMAGMNKFSLQKLINPYTGRYFEDMISVGTVFYQQLPHVVASKIQMRATGPVDQITKLVIGGRNRGGGIRAGEMEIDAFISHGALNVTLDRIMISSDRHDKVVCTKCGNEAFFEKDSAEFVCKLKCGSSHVGRITTPYSFNRFMDIIRMGGIQGTVRYVNKKEVEAANVKEKVTYFEEIKDDANIVEPEEFKDAEEPEETEEFEEETEEFDEEDI